MEVTPTFLNDYFNGKKIRQIYGESVYAYDYLRFHFDGPTESRRIMATNNNNQVARDYSMDRVMLELIHARRPSETVEIWEYRKQIFKPITKETTSAILRSLSKIRRSSDWTIKYPKENPPSTIAEDETLEQYCEYHFPYGYTSVTNWAFGVLLKNLLIDVNAVCTVLPLDNNVDAGEYKKPFPIIYNSNQVYEYIHNEVAVLLSTDKTEGNGNIFIVITPEEVQQWEQSKADSTSYTLNPDKSYLHGLSEMPCFGLPGVFKKAYSVDILKESHLSAIVPRLDEATRIYSDYQAELVMHVFSEKWEMVSQKCEECYDPILATSTGFIKSGKGKTFVKCQKCNGTGLMGAAPYKKIQIRPAKIDEQQTPIPPAGYIEKNTEIAKLLSEVVENFKYYALSAINMQFLANTPLNQSGKAKEVDKDELNNFIYSIAEDAVSAMDKVYFLCNEWRYKDLITNQQTREKMVPVIPIPEKYDILSSSYLMEDLVASRSAQLNEVTLMIAETDYVNKKYYNLPKSREKLELVFKLDPLPAINDDEKLARKQGGGVTDIDYCISCNILPFITRALDEDEDFFDKDLKEQQAVLLGFANEKLGSIKLSQRVAQEASAKITIPVIPNGN